MTPTDDERAEPIDPRNSPETNAWLERYWQQLFPPPPPLWPWVVGFVLAWFAAGLGVAASGLLK